MCHQGTEHGCRVSGWERPGIGFTSCTGQMNEGEGWIELRLTGGSEPRKVRVLPARAKQEYLVKVCPSCPVKR